MSFIIVETGKGGVYKRIPAPKTNGAATTSPLPTSDKQSKPPKLKTADEIRLELKKIRASETSSRSHSVSFN
jgi:hypothetical protein